MHRHKVDEETKAKVKNQSQAPSFIEVSGVQATGHELERWWNHNAAASQKPSIMARLQDVQEESGESEDASERS